MSKDLTNQNFSGQDLRGKKFFRNANLRGANFSKANLQKVDFSNAELQGANFQGANLREANFTNIFVDDDASPPKVNFSYANIQGVNFTDAELIGADFTGARAGLSRSWSVFVILSSVVLCLLSAFPTAIISTFLIYFSGFYHKKNYILISLIVGIWSVVLTVAIRTVLLIWKSNASFVTVHVNVGIIMMLMVLFGTIVALVTTDDQDDFGGVIWSTLAFLFLLAYIGLFEVKLEALEEHVSDLIRQISGVKTSQSSFGIFGAIIGAIFGCLFAKTAISEGKRFKWLWKIYIQFVTRGGTIFKGANLTNVAFNSAALRGANFKNAKIKRTVWNRVNQLEYAYVGNSYLKYSKVQKLILGQKLKNKEKIFNDLNLKGINLEEKDLREANFTGANLNQANLSNAKLTHAKLQQAKLNGADLTGASLTGACIHDWSIDEETILSQVKCEYIYQEKLPDPNAGYRRFPPSPRTFKAGEFEKIFSKDKGTIQLLIRSDDNKQALRAAIEQLKQSTDSRFQGLERVGEDFLFKIEIPENIDTSTVENTFYQTYKTEEENLKNKLGSKQNENLSITDLPEFLLKVLERPTNVTVNNHINKSDNPNINIAQDDSQIKTNQNKGEKE
ncbi:MAG: hypothetical protein F6J86_11485 [Symploca sp. SIO1B1]|nr:hypothetical protein [Symploca sp. SIO1C2]NER94446.1 hypothetical protein [Symploca sp. SIO1B1]